MIVKCVAIEQVDAALEFAAEGRSLELRRLATDENTDHLLSLSSDGTRIAMRLHDLRDATRMADVAAVYSVSCPE